MSTENIKRKIAALLAKAEKTDNAFEAETFMAKVNELLEKHQVEMHEIRSVSMEKDPLGKTLGETNLYVSMTWARDVVHALAKYYGCGFVYRKVGNHIRYDVVGRESARVTTELMTPFVITQVRLQAKRLANEYGITRSRAEKQVGDALTSRIWKLVRQADERREELTKNALVPVDNISSLMEELYPNLKFAKGRTLRYGQAAADLADKISLHHQATGKHTKLLS